MITLERTAQICEILTAITAVTASILYGVARLWRRHKLVKYLKDEYTAKPRRYDPGDHGRRSTIHCVSALRMSEEEILRAAFWSGRIKSTPAVGAGTTRADAIWLEYKPS
jgi:hypothetical protein